MAGFQAPMGPQGGEAAPSAGSPVLAEPPPPTCSISPSALPDVGGTQGGDPQRNNIPPPAQFGPCRGVVALRDPPRPQRGHPGFGEGA